MHLCTSWSQLGKKYIPNRIAQLVTLEMSVNWQVVEAGGGLSGDSKYSGCVSTDVEACKGGVLTNIDGFLELN